MKPQSEKSSDEKADDVIRKVFPEIAEQLINPTQSSTNLRFSNPNESNFGIDYTYTSAKFADYEFDIRYDCESNIKPVNALLWLNIYHYGKKIGTASDKDVQKLINYSEKFLKNEKLKLENIL